MATRITPEARRRSIVDAAREVFVESGLAGARTREIALRAGVAEGLLFKHFRSKDVLFEHAVVESLNTLVERLEAAAEAFAASPEVRDQTARAVEFHHEMLDTMVEIAPLLGAVLFAQRELGEDFYRRRILPTIDRISGDLELSLRRMAVPTVDLRAVALMIFGAHFFFALDADYGGSRLDVDLMARTMTIVLGEHLHLSGAARGDGASPVKKATGRASGRKTT